MKRYVLLAMVVMVAGTRSHAEGNSSPVRLTGVITEQSGSLQFVDLSQAVSINGSWEGISVEPFATIATKDVVKLEVEERVDGELYSYTLLIGPNPGSEETARVEIHHSATGFTLYAGWIYLVGRWHQLETDRVVVGAEGTKAILQVDPECTPGGTRDHHVLLLDLEGGNGLDIRMKAEPAKRGDLKAQNHYVKVDTDVNTSQQIPAPGTTLGDLKKHVTTMANLAGVN